MRHDVSYSIAPATTNDTASAITKALPLCSPLALDGGKSPSGSLLPWTRLLGATQSIFCRWYAIDPEPPRRALTRTGTGWRTRNSYMSYESSSGS